MSTADEQFLLEPGFEELWKRCKEKYGTNADVIETMKPEGRVLFFAGAAYLSEIIEKCAQSRKDTGSAGQTVLAMDAIAKEINAFKQIYPRFAISINISVALVHPVGHA